MTQKTILPGLLLLFFVFTLRAQDPIDTTIVLAEQTLLFESGQWDISTEDSILIDSLGRGSFERPEAYFEVEGHTDDVGTDEFNMELSQKRMEAVRSILLEAGVAEDAIRFEFYGEHVPISDNITEQGRQYNRRAILKWQFSETLFPISGIVRDRESKEGIPAVVEFRTPSNSSVTYTDPDGHFTIYKSVEEGGELEVYADGYFIEIRTIKGFDDFDRRPLIIGLPRAEVGKSFIMERLLFVGDRSTLLRNSRRELPRIRKFMQANLDACIEIAGHVNWPNRAPVEKSNKYYKLSVARALEIHDYLVTAGIHPDRVLAKGYGNWEMLFPRAVSERQQQQNRRVEVRIVDCERSAMEPNDTIENRLLFRQAGFLKSRESTTVNSLDKSLSLQLDRIFESDQMYRSKTAEIVNNFGEESPEMEEHMMMMRATDSINLMQVEQILAERGWLGQDQVGALGAEAIFLVILHSDLNKQIRYLPMLKQAVQNGNAVPLQQALLEDAISLQTVGEQIYGSQVGQDETGAYFLHPIRNPEGLEERRSSIGLEPMKDYAAKWGISW